MSPIRVLIVDDHRLFRQGLISLMATRPDLVIVVGEASNAREAYQMTLMHHPDVILMDIAMPGGSGLEAMTCIRQKYPHLQVVMLTASESDEDLYESIRLGAAGYLLKDLDAAELFDLLLGVAQGEAALTRSMAARLLKTFQSGDSSNQLTDREIEVLRLVARGTSNQQIADTLVISINTVKVHLRHILEKLHLENRAQAAVYAVRCGLIEKE